VLRGFSNESAQAFVESVGKIAVIYLSPGFLLAEDLYSKLVRKLEEGFLQGRPFTAVVIDGLHNLALQFPGAGDSTSLLPIIYGTLSRSNVTSITTFTTLALNTSEIGVAGDLMEESVFRLRGHLPLLHTLVQASDYVFELFRADKVNSSIAQDGLATEGRGATYFLAVQSSISRDPPTGVIGWDRQELEFRDPGWNRGEIQKSLPID
jgi:hypothetical protein